MDQQLILLAQFSNFRDSKYNQQRLQFSRKLDVNYIIPNHPPNFYSGYTALHFAVIHWDVTIVKDLIMRGADLLRYNLEYGTTPLHIATRSAKHNQEQHSIWRLTGELNNEPVINVLLSEQIKSGKSTNPKNKDGLSHLHIASIFNHAEAVNFFKDSVNDVVSVCREDYYDYTGFTALHFAIRYSSVKAAEILLKNGADIHLKDVNGVSPVYLLINRLKETSDFITMGKRNYCLSYEREITSIESIISLLLNIREENDINFVDDAGLSAFHLACCLKDSSIAHEYIKRNSDIHMQVNNNSTYWAGWSALHFAACFSPETFKLLLSKGADVNTKNVKGESALDMFTARYSPEVINSTLSIKDEFKNIFFTDKSTKLMDVILLMNDCDKFNLFLQTLPDVNIIIPEDSPLWPGYTFLHLAVSLNEKKNLGKLVYLKAAPKNKLPPHYNCTETEELMYWKRIVVCLSQRCSLTSKNSAGLTPIHLAFKLQKISAVDKLINCCKHDAVDPTGLSHFHIACTVGNEGFVQKFLNEQNINSPVKINFKWFGKTFSQMTMILHKLIHQNEESSKLQLYEVPVRGNSTPLHLAVIFENNNIVEYLLDNGANVYAEDSLGFTPIHLSMASSTNSKKLAQLLLKKTRDICDSVTQHGLSHLHVAAYANDAVALEKLIEKGADVNSTFDIPKKKYHPTPEYHLDELTYLKVNFSGRSPLHVAVECHSSDAARVLICNNANIYANTLHTSPVQLLERDIHSNVVEHFIRKFKRDKLEIGAIDFSKITALHFACARFDLKWTKKLLEYGADVNARIDNEDDFTSWNGNTPLHLFLREYSNVEIRKPAGMKKLLKLLLKHGADVMIGAETPLHIAYTESQGISAEYGEVNNDSKFLLVAGDLILESQKSHVVNPADEHGFSHFHYACLRNKTEHVEKFLHNGVDINLRTDCFWSNFSGFVPLHFACNNKAVDVTRLLIERGADVTAVDAEGNLPLHLAMNVGFVDAQIVGKMLNHGVDINTKNIFGTTPLECLINCECFTLEQFKCLLDNGASMNVESSENIIGLVLKNSVFEDRKMIINEFFNACDVKSAIEKNFKAIHSVVLVSIDDEDELTVDDYIEVISRLVKMGCDLDIQDEKGRTALHQAAGNYNRQAVEALLNLGADLNITDKNNESPFTKEIIENVSINNSNETRMVETLANHIWKMNLLDLHVSTYNKEATKVYTTYFRVNEAPRIKSEIELKIVNSTKFNSLTITSAINNYFSLPLSKRKTIDDYFARDNDMRRQFPHLSGLLRMKYSKVVIRRKLRDRAKKIFSSFEIVLPEICLNIILNYLKNYELMNFIKTDVSHHFDFML